MKPDICNSMNVVASLTAAGLGISLLPPICYRREIETGVLEQIKTRPKVGNVLFSAVYRAGLFASQEERIARYAQQFSTFIGA